jgi:hypothetical protein
MGKGLQQFGDQRSGKVIVITDVASGTERRLSIAF